MIKSKRQPCPLPHRSHAHTYHRDEVTPKHFSEGSQMSKVRLNSNLKNCVDAPTEKSPTIVKNTNDKRKADANLG